VDARAAVLRVLTEEGAALHWTKIQDAALRRRYLDPFETRDVRRAVLEALGELVAEGRVVKQTKGVYALV
jgi:hypothetical protein